MTNQRRWYRRFGDWLDDRTGLSALSAVAEKKDVPVHRHTIWYYLGGMSLFLFLCQLVSGVLLLFYYRPSAGEAFESVHFIMAEVKFGWLVRSLHAWAANLMVFTVFIHLFSVFLLKAYRAPRDLTWMSGVVLFVLTLAFGFTGYLLPWNELAFFATKVGTEIVGVVPFIGEFAKNLARGGTDVTGATLTRFYAIHVAILPAATILLVGLHLLQVQRHGMSIPPSVEKDGSTRGSMKFVPNFLLRDAVGWLVALAALAALAAFFPAHLGEKADAFAPAPVGIKPEWYFMYMFHTLKLLPSHILGLEGEMLGVMAFALAGLFLLLVPFLDRKRAPGEASRLMTVIALAMIAYIIVLTVMGYTANPTQ
ncbi:MAG: cytochrome bc complex cytochrome b subunit [Gemmatimonadetes bacterium]|nr:cytochrome bc complex cytochrome b subunit [Gemmatimonadota bacterium]